MTQFASAPAEKAASADELLKQYAAFAQANQLLPVKVTPFYQRKIDAERVALGGTHGPLYRGAYPVVERLQPDPTAAPLDFIGDRVHNRSAIPQAIIHKYRDRLLFLPTTVCAGHCQFCFRQDVLEGAERHTSTQFLSRLAELDTYLAAHTEVKEVILSGGDPMTLSRAQLAKALEMIASHTHVRDIRIHTRAIVFAPATFDDPAKLALLAEHKVRVVFHIVHPYEICDAVAAVIGTIRQAGIRMYNQFPVLRGVNDHADVLAALIMRLDALQVRPLSIYAPDPVQHTHPYRINLGRLFALEDQLRWHYPSWVNAVPFVFDTPIGKVHRDALVTYQPALGHAVFAREGQTFRYPDFPAAHDIPGERATLLWQETL